MREVAAVGSSDYQRNYIVSVFVLAMSVCQSVSQVVSQVASQSPRLCEILLTLDTTETEYS